MRRLPCIQIMPKRKPLPKWPLLIALLPVLWFVGDVVFVSWDAEVDLVASADVIVVLGCNPIQNDVPSPCMQARGGHAADLYRQGYAQNVIATGTPHEVRVLRSVLIENGVPEDAIQTDDKSHDTIQNIVNSGLILQAKGWHSVVLVTEPFHIPKLGLEISVLNAVEPKHWSMQLNKCQFQRLKISPRICNPTRSVMYVFFIRPKSWLWYPGPRRFVTREPLP